MSYKMQDQNIRSVFVTDDHISIYLHRNNSYIPNKRGIMHGRMMKYPESDKVTVYVHS